jgi:predicted PurR-regulated permease PerM
MVVAAWGLWQLNAVVVLLLLSFAIAAAVGPIADRLAEHRIPRALALAMVYFAGLALVAGLLDVIGKAVAIEAPRAADRFLAAYEHLRTDGSDGSSLRRMLIEYAPPSQTLYHELGSAPSASVALGALDLTHSLLQMVTFSTVALILSCYWVSRRISLQRILTSLSADLPTGALRIARLVAGACGDALRRALGETALAAIAMSFALRSMGMDLAALPAAAAALALQIPVAGPLLAVAVVVLAGLTTSPFVALWSGLVGAAIIVFLRGVIAPRLWPQRRSDPILVLMLAMVLASAFGVAGVVLAPLAAAGVAIVARRLVARYAISPRPLARLSALEGRALALRAQVPDAETDVAALVDRMCALTAEANGATRGVSRRSRSIQPIRGLLKSGAR